MVKKCWLKVKCQKKGTFKEPSQAKEPAHMYNQSNMEPLEFTESLQSQERLLYDFDCIYAHWKSQVKRAKQGVVNKAPLDRLQDHVDAVEGDLENLKDIYEAIYTPTSDLCHKLAKCVQVTKNIVHEANVQTAKTKQELNCQIEASVELAAIQALIAEQEQHKQRLKQLEAEHAKSQQYKEEIKLELKHLEELKMLNVTQALLPTPKQLVGQPEPTVKSLDIKGTLVLLEGTSASDFFQVNKETEVMKPVAQKAVEAKKPVAAEEPAVAKSKKVASTKPAATKKAQKKAKPAAKRVADKERQKKSTKIPMKQTGNKSDKGPTTTRKPRRMAQGNKVMSWRGKRKPKRKERTNFKEIRKKRMVLKCATVGGKNGRPPD